MDMKKYQAIFVDESREYLADAAQLVVLIEKRSTDSESLDRLFRRIHSADARPIKSKKRNGISHRSFSSRRDDPVSI